MKDIARMALEPGMEIGADVYNYKNELIISAGTKVDANVINKLARHSIMCVSIKENIDYAVTYFEKIRFSKGFASFREAYLKALPDYKEMMNQFVFEKSPLDMDKLMMVYQFIRNSLENHELLLDYLYNMLPTEDDLTYVHCLNSALIAGLFASWFSLPPGDAALLVQCAFFYDIGKLKLPNELIWKTGKLTDLEFEKIKTHTITGFQLLQDLNVDPHILKATLMHHERYDGSGYPSRLHDTQIDLFARYISIIDAYEAMTSARTYRQSKTPFEIVEIFEKDASKYDTELLRPVLSHIANHMVGLNVRLSDDQIAEVIMINQNKMGRPVVRTAEGTIIHLAHRKDISITSIY